MKHCENCKCDEVAAEKQYIADAKQVKERLEKADKFSDSELVYAAYAKCPCGAGLAYPRNTGAFGYWDCSAILKGEAKPKGHPDSVKHTDQLPFAFYEVKSELQPSANGATTRPK